MSGKIMKTDTIESGNAESEKSTATDNSLSVEGFMNRRLKQLSQREEAPKEEPKLEEEEVPDAVENEKEPTEGALDELAQEEQNEEPEEDSSSVRSQIDIRS